MPRHAPLPGSCTPRRPRPPASGPPDRATRLLVIWTCSALALLVTGWMTGCVLDVAGTSTATVGTGGSGGGTGVACTVDADCPGSTTQCRHPNCPNGTCGTYYIPGGTPCAEDGGVVCNGQGECAECGGDEHCPSGQVCQDFQCVPSTCADGVLNGDESDLDCGGLCAACENGLHCRLYSDCVSRYCVGGGGVDGDPTGVCTPCDTDDHCLPAVDTWCDEGQSDGVCADQLPPGELCFGANQCLDGHCPSQDGVCCDQPCDAATCEACVESKTDQPDGTCSFVTGGTDLDGECGATAPTSCGASGQGCAGDATACILWDGSIECAAASCQDAMATATTNCDGNGSCNQGGTQTNCSPYQCSGAVCGTSCSNDDHCVTGNFCNGSSCDPKRPNGQPCQADNWCQNNICAPDDQICCNADCTGLCESCDGSISGGSNGNCVAIPGGNDPEHECTDSSGPCGDNGNCDGNGDCDTYSCNCDQQYTHGNISEYCSQQPTYCVLRCSLGGGTTCNAICAAGGGSCVGAYNDNPDGSCGQGGGITCGATGYGSALCHCDR